MKRISVMAVMLLFIWAAAGQLSPAHAGMDFAGGVLSSPGNRFVFGQISEQLQGQYMLDTETGRLWIMGYPESGSRALYSVPYVLKNGEISLEAPTAAQDVPVVKKSDK
jgi:hypothetical protein